MRAKYMEDSGIKEPLTYTNKSIARGVSRQNYFYQSQVEKMARPWARSLPDMYDNWPARYQSASIQKERHPEGHKSLPL